VEARLRAAGGCGPSVPVHVSTSIDVGWGKYSEVEPFWAALRLAKARRWAVDFLVRTTYCPVSR
jgi:hypothetical protein